MHKYICGNLLSLSIPPPPHFACTRTDDDLRCGPWADSGACESKTDKNMTVSITRPSQKRAGGTGTSAGSVLRLIYLHLFLSSINLAEGWLNRPPLPFSPIGRGTAALLRFAPLSFVLKQKKINFCTFTVHTLASQSDILFLSLSHSLVADGHQRGDTERRFQGTRTLAHQSGAYIGNSCRKESKGNRDRTGSGSAHACIF